MKVQTDPDWKQGVVVYISQVLQFEPLYPRLNSLFRGDFGRSGWVPNASPSLPCLPSGETRSKNGAPALQRLSL